ncbi:MAG: hypothetical protein AAB723_04410 [Patescibacteria group bacterium]
MMKFFDWVLVVAAFLTLALVLAWAIRDSWGGELKGVGGQWQKSNVIIAPKN